MKKAYLTPAMCLVKLQHQSIICQSAMKSINQGDTQGETGYGGASSNNTGGIRTRESSGVWDDEW